MLDGSRGSAAAATTAFGLNADDFWAYRLTNRYNNNNNSCTWEHLWSEHTKGSTSSTWRAGEYSFGLYRVIYDNICSVNVAGRIIDRCLSLGSDADCLYKCQSTAIVIRAREGGAAPIGDKKQQQQQRSTETETTTTYLAPPGSQSSRFQVWLSSGCCILIDFGCDLHDLERRCLKRPIERMFYGCQNNCYIFKMCPTAIAQVVLQSWIYIYSI